MHIYMVYYTETLQQDIANNLPGPLYIAPEGESSDDYKKPGTHCGEQDEGSVNIVVQALLLDNNQQAGTTDGYIQQKFHRTVNAVENCSDADHSLVLNFALLPFGRP